jgi:hypothetical protein
MFPLNAGSVGPEDVCDTASRRLRLVVGSR